MPINPFPSDPITEMKYKQNRDDRFISSKGYQFNVFIGSNVFAHDFGKVPMTVQLTRAYSGDAFIVSVTASQLTISSTANGLVYVTLSV